ncbi:6-pyruvoyl trahydropterin synthase family protein [Terricaulis sp.]|uniref:6-pyruvoyl trahydropterin synthase family protein n=1 Tax=Terricaulis sp. TaxID=2768686 RepID=UPI00378501DA
MAAFQFTRRYAMAHRLLSDPASKCAVPHGHNEYVTVRLDPHEKFRFGGDNQVVSFERAKGRWHDWIDHHVDNAFMLGVDDPLIGYFREREPQRLAGIMTFPGDPTTEALAASFWLKLSAFLEADKLPFSVGEVRLEETPTNSIVLTRQSFDPATCGLPQRAWQRRADTSINDF